MSIGIVLDTEVNSLEHREVIELAYSVVHLRNGVLAHGNIVTHRFRPTNPCDSGAVSVHKIITEDLRACVPASYAPVSVPKGEYWVGHNIDFDADVLGEERIKRIDTLAIARDLWPNLKQHRLAPLYLDLYGISRETVQKIDGAHGAACDVEICLAILAKQLDAMDWRAETFEELWQYSQDCRIPKVMAFGKHKGSPIQDVPSDYVRWYASQDSTCPYLLEAFRRLGHPV